MMKKIRVAVANQFLEPVIELISSVVDVVKLWEIDATQPLQSDLRDVKGLVTCVWDKVDADYMGLFPQLEIISHLAAGVDAIDLQAAKNRKVRVTNIPNIVTDDTADLAMGLLLALSRKIVNYDKYVKSGRWKSVIYPLSTSLKNKKIGIVGLGKIGMEIARRADAFHLQVSYWGRTNKNHTYYKYVDDLIELAQTVDYLVISCAGNSETKGLIDASVLAALGPQSYLINVSRGFVVNQADLIEALNNNLIAGAGLDVFENEPHVPEELFPLENVILQPHAGTATNEIRREMYQSVADNIISYFKAGEVLTAVI